MINPVSCLPHCSFKVFLHHMSSDSHNTEIQPCGVLMMVVESEVSCHVNDPLCPMWKLYSYNDRNLLYVGVFGSHFSDFLLYMV